VIQIMSTQNNKNGFTLIEVLVAIVIMMVGLLGLLQSVNIALEANFRNQQREEVVRVGESVMNDMRGNTFGAAFSLITTVQSNIRRGSSPQTYNVRRSITSITADQTDQYRVDVPYKYKNFSTNYSIVTLRGK
jgi:type IV pilus assembly protein PilV